TSLIGTLLAGHAGLLLLEPVLKFDVAAWAGAHVAALNGVAVGVVILGILVQATAAPEAGNDAGKKDDKKSDEKHEPKDEHDPHQHEHADDHKEPKEKRAAWWKKLLGVFKPA